MGYLSSHRHRLLIVDDERDIAYILERGLTSAGFEVDAFSNPVDALAHYKANHYAHILLDIRMPGMTGFELARAIWNQDEKAQICFLSAYDAYQTEAKWVFPTLESVCFLTKPMSIAQIVVHLEKHGIKPQNKSDKNIFSLL